MKVECVPGCIKLSQGDFIDQMLVRFGMTECNTAPTPATSVRLDKSMEPATEEEKADMADVPYRPLLGGVLYAAMQTRPDISYAVSQAAKFAQNPGRQHWVALKRILRYLKGTRDVALTFTRASAGQNPPLLGFTDSDWGGDADNRKSVSGNVFVMAGGAVSWSSKQQSMDALSTAEAELVAATVATQEAVWLRRLLRTLGVYRDESASVPLRGDNTAMIAMSSSERVTARNKHIEMRYYFVRDCVMKGHVTVSHVASVGNLADMLTKNVDVQLLIKHRVSCGPLLPSDVAAAGSS
jgi:hypothetical protein